MADKKAPKVSLGDLVRGWTREAGAGMWGFPVDLATQVENLGRAGIGFAGHQLGLLDQPLDLHEKPALGSDWIYENTGGAPLNGSGSETIGRLAGGVLNPAALTAAVPRVAGALAERVPMLAEQYMHSMGMAPKATVWHGSPHVFQPEPGAPPPGKMAEILASKQPPRTTPNTGTILPRDSGMYTPGIAQGDLPRLTETGMAPEMNERTLGLLASGTARKKVNDLIKKGDALGMREWYGTEPLRQFALNEGLSQSEYERMLAHLASASQRNPVDKQNVMGSYMWQLDKAGLLTPDKELMTIKRAANGAVMGPGYEKLPPGIGSLAQDAIFERSKMIANGQLDAALPADRKLGTFYRNLLGNLRPVTVDVNALRGPVIASRRPDWLASKLVVKKGGKIVDTFTPRADFEEGRLSLEDALARPGFWEAAPNTPGEYSGVERLWQNAAKRHGIEPAESQALGWYGSADVTALKTKPELYVDNIERMAREAAKRRGVSPVQAMRDFVRARDHLGKY
jgi:hypothetical protein